jgi:hypothetical protein
VSTSIAEDSLLGYYFLPPCLTGAAYHNFIQNVLSELLHNVALQHRINLWIMHAYAPPHFLLTVQEFLNNVFPERWMDKLDQQHGLLVPLIEILMFLSLGTSKVHYLIYESH